MRFGRRLALARPPLRVDDIEALAPPLHELRDELGRILHVAVDHDDGIARRSFHTGENGHWLTEAPREPQHSHSTVPFAQRADQFLGAIGGRIDAEDDLPFLTDRVENGRETTVDRLDILFFITDRNDDAQHLYLSPPASCSDEQRAVDPSDCRELPDQSRGAREIDRSRHGSHCADTSFPVNGTPSSSSAYELCSLARRKSSARDLFASPLVIVGSSDCRSRG